MGYLDNDGLQRFFAGLKGIFANKNHDHDSRYYTESEVDSKLSSKYDAKVSRAAGTVLAAPSASDGAAEFRKLVKSDISDFPTSLKNPNKLTVQGNGTTLVDYDGSTAMTANITKATIGLGNVDNTADNTKSVKYAASAGNATNDASGAEFQRRYWKRWGGVPAGTDKIPDADLAIKQGSYRYGGDNLKNFPTASGYGDLEVYNCAADGVSCDGEPGTSQVWMWQFAYPTSGSSYYWRCRVNTNPWFKWNEVSSKADMDVKLNKKANGQEWNATIKCATWSRICLIPANANITGSAFILNVAATRNSVVYNETFAVNVNHDAKATIVKIGSSKYSSVHIRIVANSGGSCYVELYDNASSATNATSQTVKCSLVAIRTGEVTCYTAFTDGTTLPSNYIVAANMTTNNRAMQADFYWEDIIGRPEAYKTYYDIKKTVNLSSLDQNTWYPVTGTKIPDEGPRKIKCSVHLDSGTTPEWSSHGRGFSVDFEAIVIASGWGATLGHSLVLTNSAVWVKSGEKPPVGYQQMTNSSTPVFWLRGGGSYYLSADWDCNWTIQTAAYTAYSQTVSPSTDYPGVSITKSTISANLDGEASTATVARKIGHAGSTGTAMQFNWAGKDGTPNWVWGADESSQTYVYNPRNFDVGKVNGFSFSAGTTDMVAGETSLETNKIYIMYQ